MSREINMTTGNPTRLILRLAIPLILTNLGQQLYGIVDAIIVGKGVGVNAFAALGATDWLNWLVLWSVQGLTQGFSSLVAQKFGAGDTDKMKRTIGMCFWLSLLFGSAITIASVIFANPLLSILGTPKEVLPDATVYLTMIYSGTLIVLGYNMAAAMLRAVGDGKTPLIAMCIAGGTNILLDIIFVMNLNWGIMGAAAATLLAQCIAFLYCLRVIVKSPVFTMKKEHWKWEKSIGKELCRLGTPMALSVIIVDIGGILAQYVINSFGAVFVAGCTAANKLHGTLDTSAVAIGFASCSFIGQNYGAKRFDRIHVGIKKATIIAVVIGGAITVFMFIFGKPIIGLFLTADTPNAVQALEVAYKYVMVMSAMLIGAYIMNLYRYSLQGLGNSRSPMISGFYELGARVFVAFVFPVFMGEMGLFFMDGSAWWAAGIFQMVCFYLTLKKKENRTSSG